MPAHTVAIDNPDPVHLSLAAEAQAAGAAVAMDGAVLRITYPDPRPLDIQKADLVAQLADRRWRASQTCTWRGAPAPSDAQAGTNVLGAIVGLQLAAEQGPIAWKFDGGFQELSLADLIDLGQTMRAHVQACFVNEARIAALIAAAADAAELDAIDLTAGWPG